MPITMKIKRRQHIRKKYNNNTARGNHHCNRIKLFNHAYTHIQRAEEEAFLESEYEYTDLLTLGYNCNNE